MKNSRKTLVVTVLIMIGLLSACGNSSAEPAIQSSNNDMNEDLANNEPQAEDDQSIAKINDQNTTTNMDDEGKVVRSETSSESEESSKSSNTHNDMSGNNREMYLEKLNDTKEEVDKWEATDSSTYALKNVENKRWETWDDLLNEVYGVLQDELPQEEMDLLREEQRNWIEDRDDRALEASEKYKGGTQEHLEYVSVLANVTEKRCYELVENYM